MIQIIRVKINPDCNLLTTEHENKPKDDNCENCYMYSSCILKGKHMQDGPTDVESKENNAAKIQFDEDVRRMFSRGTTIVDKDTSSMYDTKMIECTICPPNQELFKNIVNQETAKLRLSSIYGEMMRKDSPHSKSTINSVIALVDAINSAIGDDDIGRVYMGIILFVPKNKIGEILKVVPPYVTTLGEFENKVVEIRESIRKSINNDGSERIPAAIATSVINKFNSLLLEWRKSFHN